MADNNLNLMYLEQMGYIVHELGKRRESNAPFTLSS